MLLTVPWDAIIFDEAHYLKNYDSKRTKGAYILAYRAPRVIFLTGTPIRNTPLDLFPLFHIMNPKEYTNWKRWRDWFCVTEREEIWVKNSHTGKPTARYVTKILPGEKNGEQLAQLLALYSVCNVKSEVMPQLPPKQYRIVPVELGHERAQYKTMEDEFFALLDSGVEVTAQVVVAQLMRLRQICLDPNTLHPEGPYHSSSSSKTQTLLDVLDETEGKVVVFTFFERYVQVLVEEFNKAGINHRIITGKSKDSLKAELDFQHDPSVKVILGTIGAMGEGFTLTAADTVIRTDMFWTPAVNEQCEDRVHGRVDKGLDSTKSTLIIDLFCPNTVEEHVRAIALGKEKMITDIEAMARVVSRMRASRRN
jgi:SNF2 family DNA or RNA helicase